MTDPQTFPWQPFRPDADLILEAVAYSYRTTTDEITGPSRTHLALRPRQAAAWLLRDLLGMSYPKIGKALNRDHTTAVNLVRRANEYAGKDPAFRDELDTMAVGIRQVATMPHGCPETDPNQQRLHLQRTD